MQTAETIVTVETAHHQNVVRSSQGGHLHVALYIEVHGFLGAAAGGIDFLHPAMAREECARPRCASQDISQLEM